MKFGIYATDIKPSFFAYNKFLSTKKYILIFVTIAILTGSAVT